MERALSSTALSAAWPLWPSWLHSTTAALKRLNWGRKEFRGHSRHVSAPSCPSAPAHNAHRCVRTGAQPAQPPACLGSMTPMAPVAGSGRRVGNLSARRAKPVARACLPWLPWGHTTATIPQTPVQKLVLLIQFFKILFSRQISLFSIFFSASVVM